MNTHILHWPRLFCLICLVLLTHSTTRAQSALTSGGWFVRGTGTNLAFYSMVIPLDGEIGVTNGPSLATTYTNIGATNVYHLNATNPLSQNILTNRIAVSNAVAAFGSKYAGSPLYYNKDYSFGVYAGDFTEASMEAVAVTVRNRTTGAWVNWYWLSNAIPSVTNDWNMFIQ